ncbi:Pentatricopeptide repeat-containing protein [Nymphaea thermarum]|nr:Pentatricopeptide repeat-containing protein [Nymphaea thermarum]
MGAHWMVFRKCCNKFHFHFCKFGPIQKLRIPIASLSTLAQVRPDINRVDHEDWLSPNEVLKVFDGIRDPQLLISTFHKASLRKDYKPNEALYSIIFERLAHAQMFDAIEDLLIRIKMERCMLSDEFFHEAFQLYERTDRAGCHHDTITFNILISGLCKQKRVAEAMDLLDKMKGKGCLPNSGSYLAVIYGLLDIKKSLDAKEYLYRMISEGSAPSFRSFKLLIQGLCTERLLDDAELVLREMIRHGFVPRMGTWRRLLNRMFPRAGNTYVHNDVIDDLTQLECIGGICEK